MSTNWEKEKGAAEVLRDQTKVHGFIPSSQPITKCTEDIKKYLLNG